MRHIDHLEIGGRRDGSGLDGEDSRDGDEAADVLEHTGGLGGGGDARRRYKNTYLDVHRIFQHDIRSDIILEVFIYIPEHIRRDVNGADVRSGRGSDLHTTAREAMVSVSFSAFAVLVTLKHRRGGDGGSASDRPQRHRGGGGLDGGLTTARCCNGLSRSTLQSSGSGKWSRGCGPRLLRRWWRYCGLMLGGKRMRDLLHWRGNGGQGGWRWWQWPRHCDNLSKPSLKRGGSANRLGEGVILKGRVLEDLPDEGKRQLSELRKAGRAEGIVAGALKGEYELTELFGHTISREVRSRARRQECRGGWGGSQGRGHW
jgi:hypothetical protein